MHFIKHRGNKYYKIISSSSFYMLPLPLLLRSFTFIMCILCVEQCCSAMGSAPFPALYSVSQSRLESPRLEYLPYGNEQNYKAGSSHLPSD